MNAYIDLTRKQYDSLIERFPHLMATEWQSFRKDWTISGVRVYFPETPKPVQQDEWTTEDILRSAG